MTDNTDSATIIADILTAMHAHSAHAAKARQCPGWTEDRRLRREIERLSQGATQAFAALNGWWDAGSKTFGPEDIGKRNSVYRGLQHPVFDHCLYFRADSKNAALVTQPYADCRHEAVELAEYHGVALHVATNPKAIFWYPSSTFFLVFTARAHVMRWLPEQIKAPERAA